MKLVPKFQSSIISLFCAGGLLSQGALAQGAAPVPQTYASSYAAINNALVTFNTSLDNRVQLPPSTNLAASLEMADGGRGTTALTAIALTDVKMEIARYQQLGVRAVTIQLGFPLLVPKFFSWNGDPSDAPKFVSFYQQVVNQCHNSGIKVIVEVTPNLTPAGLNVLQYCQSLSAQEYQNEMCLHCSNLASLIKPDCISIVAEPDTATSRSGQNVYQQPASMAAFCQAAAASILAAAAQVSPQYRSSVDIAAGACPWMSRAQKYLDALINLPGLTAIDLHSYYIGNGDMETMTNLADQVNAAHMRVMSSECWLNKAGTGSPPSGPAGSSEPTVARSTNTFSFWEPLDMNFMHAMVTWCRVERPSYFTFFDSQLLFNYFNYSQVQSLTDPQIISAETTAQRQAIYADQFSSIGLYYGQILKSVLPPPSPCQVMPPPPPPRGGHGTLPIGTPVTPAPHGAAPIVIHPIPQIR